MEKRRPTRRTCANTMADRGIVPHERVIMECSMAFKSAARAVLAPLLLTSILAAGSAATSRSAWSPAMDEQVAGSRSWVTLPQLAEHRYRIAAKIRLLLFWVGRDNVGTARMG